ncbi:N-6 DNA methylase [Streptomyces sp. NPDC048445]|uniref:N-6 DNA methylase n=1 Tax=Streptomyces sp. NPDC048445 TaxID=3365553 RepID=UPI003712D5AF
MSVTIKLLDSARYDEPAGHRLCTVLAQAAQSTTLLQFGQGRHASAQSHWHTTLGTGASRRLDLVRSTLQGSLEPHSSEAAVRDLRSYAHQRLTAKPEQPPRTPDKLGRSHDQRVTQQRPSTDRNAWKQAEAVGGQEPPPRRRTCSSDGFFDWLRPGVAAPAVLIFSTPLTRQHSEVWGCHNQSVTNTPGVHPVFPGPVRRVTSIRFPGVGPSTHRAGRPARPPDTESIHRPYRSGEHLSTTLLSVIALSADLFAHTTVPVHIWLLARDASHHLPAGEADSVLFIDASRLGTQTPRGTRELLPADTDRVNNRFHAWQKSPATTTDELGFSCSVPYDEILEDDNCSLDPRLHVAPARKRHTAAMDTHGLLHELAEQAEAAVGATAPLHRSFDRGERAACGEPPAARMPLRHLVDSAAGGERTARSLLLAGPSGSLIRADTMKQLDAYERLLQDQIALTRRIRHDALDGGLIPVP